MLYTWHNSAIEESALEEQKMLEVSLADKTIGLLKRAGAVFAFSAKCPHASANLCDGWIDAQGRVVCPLHSYRFDPTNGRNTSGEGYKLKTYPVEIRAGYIYIGIL